MNDTERERLFVELFTENRARLLRLCRGYLHGADEAEDLFQDVMVNVWKNLAAFRGDAKPTTWLYRIAVNTALLYRGRQKRAASVIRPPGDQPLPDIAHDPHAAVHDADRLQRLYDAIATLAAEDRLIITLVLDGLSYREIAEVAGITANYAGVRISWLKRVLEKRVKDTGHEL